MERRNTDEFFERREPQPVKLDKASWLGIASLLLTSIVIVASFAHWAFTPRAESTREHAEIIEAFKDRINEHASISAHPVQTQHNRQMEEKVKEMSDAVKENSAAIRDNTDRIIRELRRSRR
jgi:regulatory protein YycI of two-component signal transduction system YycFG